MGNMASRSAPIPFSNEAMIRVEMRRMLLKWDKVTATTGESNQNALFQKIVPLEKVDFTGTFTDNGLNTIFTNTEKVKTEMMGPYNCNHLYRSSQEDPDIPILDTGDDVIIAPLGDPGLAIGDQDEKVTHLLGIPTTGNFCFNEMIPGNSIVALEKRIAAMNKAYENLKNNVPLKECGKKVIDKATKMGVSEDRGIRDFMGDMILALTPELKGGRPGYRLLDKNGEEYSGNEEKVRSTLNRVFSKFSPMICIQPPWINSQLVTHLHGFNNTKVQSELSTDYRDINIVMKISKEREEPTVDDDDEGLTRTVTNDGGLTRCSTVSAGGGR
jgi:hypothetical protein